MNISCPSCSASGSVDASKLPAEGRPVVCPKCASRFQIKPESVDVVPPPLKSSPEERMTCPKCGCEQQKGESCAICCIDIEKYLLLRARLATPDRPEVLKNKSELRVTDAWYHHDLFDRRLTTMLIRVLTLLLMIGLYLSYFISNSRQMTNNIVVEVDSVQSTAQRNANSDDKFKARFDTVVNGLNADIDQCFSQCYSYLSSPWYLQGDAKPTWTRHRHILTDSMQEEYNKIVIKKHAAASTYDIPTPSPQYYDCFVKVRGLFNLYNSLYKYAENYESYHYGFSAALSNLSFEHMKLIEELKVCRSSF